MQLNYISVCVPVGTNFRPLCFTCLLIIAVILIECKDLPNMTSLKNMYFELFGTVAFPITLTGSIKKILGKILGLDFFRPKSY